ncbi:MAG: aspartate aminotransferase family protein [Deltaproteobacteria bacterium]|nr:aspartate aminotransferase family protein [Deltaproteobacteria bacterium]MBW2374095.1 aspartate aminotransferase family protein [Deltaproteobacteria bacterium]
MSASRFNFVPSSHGPPLSIARAEGAWLETTDGQRILDAAGGAIMVNVGHGRREVIDAMTRTLERVTYAVPVFATEERERLVERLIDRWLPGDLARVYLTSGGSESVDAALRLARQHHVAAGRPERWKILGRDLSYHGTTLATLAAGGHEKRRAPFGPLLLDFPKAPACYCLRCPLGREYPECRVACADAVEEVLLREGPETVAAFIAEPVVGSTAGAVDPPPEYWPAVVEVCRRHGVLVIADEVMTGFGRTGRRFGVEHWDVVPDILVGGKGLAGGYAPLGAVFASEAVLEPLAQKGDELMYYTYGGHPSACAAADAVLEILEREDLVRRAADLGARLRKALEPLEDHPNVAQVRGLGLLQAVELVRDRETLEPFPAEVGMAMRVVVQGLVRGAFFYPGGCGPARDVVCLGPPFIIGDEELELIARILPEAIDAAVASADR